MLFQKNTWADAEVVIALAHDFTRLTRNKHGNVWKPLHLDNLSVHCNAEAKRIYWDGRAFSYYYPAQPSEFAQAIESGLGMSVRIEVGNLLDMWLMEEENILKQEDKMMASKRAIEKVLKKDEMRVRRFVRTSSLLQQTKSEADHLIKPQGVESNIILSDAYVEDEEIGEFAEPSTSVALQGENMGNISTGII